MSSTAASRLPFQRYTLFQTNECALIIGYDVAGEEYSCLRVYNASSMDTLRIDGGVDTWPLKNFQKRHVFSHGDIGIRKVADFFAFLGFLELVHGVYAMVVSKRKTVGKLLNRHCVYTAEKVELLPLCEQKSREKRREDLRYEDFIFSSLDTGSNFFFCYSYDMSASAQRNASTESKRYTDVNGPESRFDWNCPHTKNMHPSLLTRWTVHLIQGFFDQAVFSAVGRVFELTLLARRSRAFAGVRYRRRGCDASGCAANEVEVEQIVYDWTTDASSSFVQNRGSVPLVWSQEPTALALQRPQIFFEDLDPLHDVMRLHIQGLFTRYGCPVQIVNLLKSTEKPKDDGGSGKATTGDELELSRRFEEAVMSIQHDMPKQVAIEFLAWDLKESRLRGEDIKKRLEELGARAASEEGIFVQRLGTPMCVESLQCGVTRVNCLDCLDRTNVLQFVVGQVVLQRQLHALGLITSNSTVYHPIGGGMNVSVSLSEMYSALGDRLALQYAGSVTHKKYQLEDPGHSQAAISSSELLTSIKRHYTSSFSDTQRQLAMNLLLGLHVPRKHPAPWDRDIDGFLQKRPVPFGWFYNGWWRASLLRHLKILAAIPGVNIKSLRKSWITLTLEGEDCYSKVENPSYYRGLDGAHLPPPKKHQHKWIKDFAACWRCASCGGSATFEGSMAFSNPLLPVSSLSLFRSQSGTLVHSKSRATGEIHGGSMPRLPTAEDGREAEDLVKTSPSTPPEISHLSNIDDEDITLRSIWRRLHKPYKLSLFELMPVPILTELSSEKDVIDPAKIWRRRPPGELWPTAAQVCTAAHLLALKGKSRRERRRRLSNPARFLSRLVAAAVASTPVPAEERVARQSEWIGTKGCVIYNAASDPTVPPPPTNEDRNKYRVYADLELLSKRGALSSFFSQRSIMELQAAVLWSESNASPIFETSANLGKESLLFVPKPTMASPYLPVSPPSPLCAGRVPSRESVLRNPDLLFLSRVPEHRRLSTPLPLGPIAWMHGPWAHVKPRVPTRRMAPVGETQTITLSPAESSTTGDALKRAGTMGALADTASAPGSPVHRNGAPLRII